MSHLVEQFVCAECGTRDATTYAVTGAVDDKEGRTEACRSCDDALRFEALREWAARQEEGPEDPLDAEEAADWWADEAIHGAQLVRKLFPVE